MPRPKQFPEEVPVGDLEGRVAILEGIIQAGNWQIYTPTWSGTLGNGALSGSFVKIGKLVVFELRLTWGTSTTHPASLQSFGLPTSSSHTGWAVPVQIRDDSGPQEYSGTGRISSTGVVAIAVQTATNNGRISDAHPFTWADADTIRITGLYETV